VLRREQVYRSRGGFTSTGEEWKMSPSFQNSWLATLRESLTRSRCSPVAQPWVMHLPLLHLAVPPQFASVVQVPQPLVL